MKMNNAMTIRDASKAKSMRQLEPFRRALKTIMEREKQSQDVHQESDNK